MSGKSLVDSGATARLIREELQPALDAARTLPSEELAAFLGELEIVRASAWVRLIRPTPTEPSHDQLLDVDAAAARLSVSPDYLYHNHGRFPFTRRVGRNLRFSHRGIERFIQNARVLGAKRPSARARLPQ